MQDTEAAIVHWIASLCHNGLCKHLHNRSNLRALGIILSISGIFRFYLDSSLLLLLFNWIICIVLESMAMEIFFQISWRQLKFQNITSLRCLVFVLIFTLGLINIYSMWQLCWEVRDCVACKEHNWLIVAPPMWLTISTAMLHTIILAISVPVQVIIIPLECNRNIPNINFKSRNITLAVNFWLFVHFVYLSINYSYYNNIALFYRLFCTVWMFLYCYPKWTQTTYHRFKQQLPNWIRPYLRSLRDNKFVIKVWRNLRAVIAQRRREGNVVDNQTSILNMLRSHWNVVSDMARNLRNINSLWTVLRRNAKFWLPCVISCMLVSCLLNCIECEFTSVVLALSIHMFITYLMFHLYFDNIVNQSITPISNETNISIINPVSSIVNRSTPPTDNEPTIPLTNSNECTDKFKYDTGYPIVITMNSVSNELKKYHKGSGWSGSSELVVGIKTQS